MTTPIPASAPAETPKKRNCLLWGCLIVILLIIISCCCLGSLIALPLFTDFDPLGMDLRNRINEVIPWQDLLEDPSRIPGLEQYLPDDLDSFLDETPDLDLPTPGALAPTRPSAAAQAIPLTTYTAADFPATFSYPAGWDVEPEEYGVTFYDPESYTYLYVGEYLVDPGVTAEQAALGVLDSLREDAQEDTFLVIESTPWTVPTGDDAYLIAFEFVDTEGYYQWVFDLETVNGESNVYFFLSGEDPADASLYGELIEIIGDSFRR